VKVSSEEFRAFVARRGAQLHRTAYLLCGDWHLANDVVQDTLVKACQHWKRVQRAESPDAYVQRILVNEVNRTWRRRDKVVVLQGEVDRVPTAPDQTDLAIERGELFRALESLPARQRVTVVLRYLEGWSERETAGILKCSEGTVKSQSSRALHAMKSILEREELVQ